LKHIAQELPGVAVFLCGRPLDAMPMLRYFAGPGVELRDWPAATPEPKDAMIAVASELFEKGFGPVLVRTADAPEPAQEALLACAEAARHHVVLAKDQRGAAWLMGWPTAAHLGAPSPVKRGPWARTVQNDLDLRCLLHERSPRAGDLPSLPVRNLQAALHYYETVFGAELLFRSPDSASVRSAAFAVRLCQRGADFTPNGLWLPCDDPTALLVTFGDLVRLDPGDEPAEQIGGGIGLTLTDQDGNRITLGTAAIAR